MILAIDPGSSESAWLIYNPNSGMPQAFGKVANEILLDQVRDWGCSLDHLVIEGMQSFGMPVGKEVFETCYWIGRYIEAFRFPFTMLYRGEVKLHICGSAKAKDPNIRQALIDKFGGPDSIKKGGPLKGISKDVWSALAIAVTYAETVKS